MPRWVPEVWTFFPGAISSVKGAEVIGRLTSELTATLQVRDARVPRFCLQGLGTVSLGALLDPYLAAPQGPSFRTPSS